MWLTVWLVERRELLGTIIHNSCWTWLSIVTTDESLLASCPIQVLASRTKIYMVMELVEGGELFDTIIHRGKLEEGQARKYFQQLIDAVDYCHSRGVCHRDLKVRQPHGCQLYAGSACLAVCILVLFGWSECNGEEVPPVVAESRGPHGG